MPAVYRNGAGPIPAGAILIDRTTPFGNPYRITAGRTREEAITMFDAWIRLQPVLMEKIRRELRGKDLVCHCKPLPCHGDVLLRIANEGLTD